MNILQINLGRVALLLAAALGSAGTHAQLVVVDPTVNLTVQTVGSAIVQAIGATTSAVSAAATSINTVANQNFQNLFQVIKGVGVEQAQATNESAKMVSQANTRTAYDVARAATMPRYTVSNPCAVVAAAGMAATSHDASVAAAGVGRGGTAAAGVVAGSGGASSDLARAIAISKGAEAAPSPEVSAKLAASGACAAFATGTRAAACNAAQFSTGQANPYADADVKADTLFDGPQAANAPRKKYTIDSTAGSAERTAVEAYLRNLGTPLELRSLGRGELGTDAGRRYLAIKDSYEARMSLAEQPMRRHVGNMTASVASKPVLDRLLASQDADFVLIYLNASFPDWSSKGISSDDLMELEVERRYMNKAWLTRTAAMSPDEVARESLQTLAFQNALLWKGVQESRLNGVLLGALVAAQVRSESLPDLKEAHAKAAR